MDDIISATVLIPRRRLSELYTLSGGWIKELDETGPNETVVRSGEWDLEDPAALISARLLYSSISKRAREILDFLIDHAGDRFTAEQLVTNLGFGDVNKLTGTLSSITRRANTDGRGVPYHYEEGHYWVEPGVTKTFLKVREEGVLRRETAAMTASGRRRGTMAGVPLHRGISALNTGEEEVSMQDSE